MVSQRALDQREKFRPDPPPFVPKDRQAWEQLPDEYKKVIRTERDTDVRNGKLSDLLEKDLFGADETRILILRCLGATRMTQEQESALRHLEESMLSTAQ